MSGQQSLIEVPDPQPTQTGMDLMIERLAANPNVDVDKLRQILDMQERVLNRDAETAFNIAFNQMQPEIPVIAERSRTDKTKYAPLEDIIEIIRPIYSRHGFSLSFATEWPDDKTVKVIGILTHKDGHSRKSEFRAVADQTGSKNAIQALGSTITYGKRYTTNDLFCIVTRDDDGTKAGQATAPEPPKGYDKFIEGMEDAAVEGQAALEACFRAAPKPLQNYLSNHDTAVKARLKAKAGSKPKAGDQ